MSKKPKTEEKALAKPKKRFSRLSMLVNLLVFMLVLALVAAYLVKEYFVRAGHHSEVVVIDVPQGSGLNAVTKILEDRDLIANATFFKVAAYYQGIESDWKFGEYEIPAHASMADIQDILTEGKAIQLSVTLPEGLTSWQFVQRLNAVPELTGEITEIPAEGSLAPNTYSFLRGDDRQLIIDRMQEDQIETLAQAWENRAEGLPLNSPEELLILASIVERETGNAEERPIVASVFVNRLNQGIKLQTDPTVIYGITLGEGGLGRGLRRSELNRETPYNTYVIPGLPPTPIANPGKAALQAVANPADTEFIYFVAKTLSPRDGHVFAKTLDEHNANVANYRRLESEAN